MELTQIGRCSYKQASDSSNSVADSGSERAMDCIFKSCQLVVLELMIAVSALGFEAMSSLDPLSNCFEEGSGICYKSTFVFRSTNSD